MSFFVGSQSDIRRGIHVESSGGVNSLQYFSSQSNAVGAFDFPFGGETGERNVVRGPHFVNTDFAILKDFKMPWSEKHSLRFRAEAFNLFNHSNFTPPDYEHRKSGQLRKPELHGANHERKRQRASIATSAHLPVLRNTDRIGERARILSPLLRVFCFEQLRFCDQIEILAVQANFILLCRTSVCDAKMDSPFELSFIAREIFHGASAADCAVNETDAP